VELLLIRHALPVRIELDEGRADPHLSDLGHRQSEALAAWLEDEGIDAIYTSPMKRAVETAGPLVSTTGLIPTVADGLAEWDRESASYIPIEEMKAEGDPRWHELVTGAFVGESATDPLVFRDTVVATIEKIIDASPGMKVAAICHGGVVNVYLGNLLGIERAMFFEPGYTSISRVHASRRGHRTLGSINELAHLRALST
jgi:probable phosphoglycerate mutase